MNMHELYTHAPKKSTDFAYIFTICVFHAQAPKVPLLFMHFLQYSEPIFAILRRFPPLLALFPGMRPQTGKEAGAYFMHCILYIMHMIDT